MGIAPGGGGHQVALAPQLCKIKAGQGTQAGALMGDSKGPAPPAPDHLRRILRRQGIVQTQLTQHIIAQGHAVVGQGIGGQRTVLQLGQQAHGSQQRAVPVILQVAADAAVGEALLRRPQIRREGPGLFTIRQQGQTGQQSLPVPVVQLIAGIPEAVGLGVIPGDALRQQL